MIDWPSLIDSLIDLMKGDFDKTAVYEVGLVKAVGFHKDALGPILPLTFTWVESADFLLYSDRFLPGYSSLLPKTKI